ncbi:Protein of unknown function [Parasphingorhabdus marina DSM 22363]|uniref:DUF2924 domain-containing protein n=1 Tax=Parasphingorhabdus marina DSM 22363 TaxID=1123272 RepID=A0A1N6D4X7_9SPHN|nr:DUF2924 domain-containing protein [Parasphingorhabdus marina]SIN65704.1 Protein of unknown function [Parasphingorhabdus marina DSM 22363]
MDSLNDRIEALKDMPKKQLRVEWQHVYRSEAPDISSGMLRLGIAYRLQEKHFGGLSPKTITKLKRIAKKGRAALSGSDSLKPGTRLVRSWNGQTLAVLVVDDGFIMGDKHYRSLSEIAREVTGAHWSGPRFFGLTGKHAA